MSDGQKDILDSPAPATRKTISAAGYIRLTRDESLQNNLSAPAQRKGIAEYAKRAKLGPLHYFEETRAVGGDIPFERRPAGARLIAAITAGQIKHVIVRDIDRLTRDLALGMEFVDLCHKHRVTIHTFTGAVQTRSASDRFAFQVRSAAAEFEKNQTGDRVRKAKREAIEQGRWQGPPAYGYTSQAHYRSQLIRRGLNPSEAELKACSEYPQKARLYVCPKEAEAVRLIYELAAKGLGSRRIVNELNSRGYRTRTGVYWSSERLRRTLQNPAAAGYLAANPDTEQTGVYRPHLERKLFKGSHEAIIMLEQWQSVQQQRRANLKPGRRIPGAKGTSKQERERVYVLSGILRCRCGSPMRGKSHRANRSGRYVCSRAFNYGKKTVNGCDHGRTTLNMRRLHEAFWQALHRILAKPELVDQLYAATVTALKKAELDATGQVNVTPESLTFHLEKVERQLEMWYRRHDDALGDAEQEAAWRRIVEITDEKKRIEQKLDAATKSKDTHKIVTRREIEEHLSALGDLIRSSDQEELRGFVRSLADEHGLSLQMISSEQIQLRVRLAMPHSNTEATDEVSETLSVPLDWVGEWVTKHQGTCRCCYCGKDIEVLRRHHSLGLPKCHRSCHTQALGERRQKSRDQSSTL